MFQQRACRLFWNSLVAIPCINTVLRSGAAYTLPYAEYLIRYTDWCTSIAILNLAMTTLEHELSNELTKLNISEDATPENPWASKAATPVPELVSKAEDVAPPPAATP